MFSGVDRYQGGELDPLTRPTVDLIRIVRHRLAGLLIEQPNMEALVVEFGCRSAVDGDLIASTDGRHVLPEGAVKPAAVIPIAPVKDPMHLRLRSAAIVEAVALADNPIFQSDFLRCERLVNLCHSPAHLPRFSVIEVTDRVPGRVPKNDRLKRLVDDGRFLKRP